MNYPNYNFPLALHFPNPPLVSFDGFGPEAFSTLDAIKKEPHIGTYRPLKPVIEAAIKQPFKQFRDDLVVNWVLPNELPFETERNVFSRLLKNDFGNGGCHHHLWLAFYREGLRRLSDLQVTHTIRDNGFSSSLYIGENAPVLFNQIKRQIIDNPLPFVSLVDELLVDNEWVFRFRPEKANRNEYEQYKNSLSVIPTGLGSAKGIWWHKFYPKDTILNKGPLLVESSLQAIKAVWPLYLFLLNESRYIA